jgi:hypothetical protein
MFFPLLFHFLSSIHDYTHYGFHLYYADYGNDVIHKNDCFIHK